MALNIKHKKTSLEEDAFIYAKRDEEESEKSKWSKMNKEQKISYFKAYYLRPLIIGCAVLVLLGFFLYKDVIMKKDVVYRCALINEMATEIPIETFADGFTSSMGLDPKRNLASFHMYYTNTEIANEVGAAAATDLTQISSMIYATMLDSIIAGEEDFNQYLENAFFVDLTTILSEKELAAIQDHLYIPDTPENKNKHPYGVYLDGNKVYETIFEGGGGVVEKPLYGIIFNSEKKENSKKLLYYLFPELNEVTE